MRSQIKRAPQRNFERETVVETLDARRVNMTNEPRNEPTLKQLGQYRLIKLLGSGGMGDVYLAEHLMLKRLCAIKVIHAEQAHDSHALARFEREVQMTAQLSHWNTVQIFDYGRTEDGTFF